MCDTVEAFAKGKWGVSMVIGMCLFKGDTAEAFANDK